MSSAQQEHRASSLADDVMGSSNNVSVSTSSVSIHVDPTVHEPRAISAPSTHKIAKTSVKAKSLTATASKVSRKEITNNVKDDNGKKLQEPDDPELIITRGLKEILAKDRAMRKNNELSVSKKCKTSGRDSNKGKGPNFVICYLCGRQFGSSSISIHRPQCYLKMLIAWERGDPATRGPRPLDPESYEANVKAKMAANKSSQAGSKISQLQYQEQQSKPMTLNKQSDANKVTSVIENTDNKENLTEKIISESNEKMLENISVKEEGNEYDATELYNELALEAFKKQLAPCPHCHRTFLPDRLVVHLRSCKPKVSDSNEDDHHDVKSKKKEISTSLTEVHTSNDESKKNNNNKHQTSLTQSDANKSNQKSEHKTSLQEMIKLKRKELKQKVSDDTTTEQMEKVESNEYNKKDGVSDIDKSEKKGEKKMLNDVHEIQHYEEEEYETKHEQADLHDTEEEDAALNENGNAVMNRTSQVIEPEARTESPGPHPPTEENVSSSNSLCTTTATTMTNKKEEEENVYIKEEEHKVKEISKTRHLLEEEEHKAKCKETFTNLENENTEKACSTSRENSLLLETLPYTSATDEAALPPMEAEAIKEGKEEKETSQESKSKETSVKNETNKCTNDDHHNDNDGDVIDGDEIDDENYDYQVKKIKLNNVSHFKNVPSRLKAELEAHRIRFSEPVVCTYCHKKFHTQRIKQHEELCALRNSPQLHAEVKRAKSNRSMSGGNSNQSRQLFATTNNSTSVNTNSSFDSKTNRSKSLSNSPMSSFTKRTSQSVGAMPLVMTGPTIKITEVEQNDHVIRRALSVNDDRLSVPPNDQDSKGGNSKKARINKKLETKSKNSRGNTKNKTVSSTSLPSHTTDSETISGEVAINVKLKTHEVVSQNKNVEGMSAQVAIKYCPECGVKVQHDKQKFCMSCGTKICV